VHLRNTYDAEIVRALEQNDGAWHNNGCTLRVVQQFMDSASQTDFRLRMWRHFVGSALETENDAPCFALIRHPTYVPERPDRIVYRPHVPTTHGTGLPRQHCRPA